MIDKFKKKGGKFIWTIHNILPYNASFENEEVKLRKEIIKRADKIHATGLGGTWIQRDLCQYVRQEGCHDVSGIRARSIIDRTICA